MNTTGTTVLAAGRALDEIFPPGLPKSAECIKAFNAYKVNGIDLEGLNNYIKTGTCANRFDRACEAGRLLDRPGGEFSPLPQFGIGDTRNPRVPFEGTDLFNNSPRQPSAAGPRPVGDH